MKLREFARCIDRSLDAWRPELLPRLDRLDVITPRPEEDFAAEARAEARAEVTTPKVGKR